tara:strand:- start:4672 stop:7929 length:3258 start_codon:yes stop_codon:yes gene_type:complete
MAEKPTIVKNNRGKQISRLGDKTKSVSVGLMDMDSAIFFYFENVIKPFIEENGEQVKVPVIYANPERWAALQKQGFIRDQKRKVMAPVIAFRRTGFQRDDNIPVDKIDPMDPKLHLHYESQYTRENRYDKLTALRGLTPKKEIFSVAVPDYVQLSYDFIVWTNFTDHMNSIIEKINWSEGSYWGDPGKFRFRTRIDNYSDASEYEGTTRKIKTSFSLTLHGYLLPDEYPPTAVNTEKFITPKQIILNDSTDINVTSIAGIDEEGARTVTVINNIAKGGGGGGGTAGAVQPLILDSGLNMVFDNTSFTGETSKTVTLATSPTPTFSTITTTGGITASGNIVTSGNIIAEQYIVSSSISIITQSFSSGSTIFGDTPVDDTHQFTGSLFVNSATTQSTAIFADNIQTGYPTSNNWKENLDGSFFNNFDNTTHVSEILRFMAGIISHSIDTASPTPNTKTFASVDTNNNNLGSTANQISGRLPQNFIELNNDTLDYLVSKGWTSVGAKVFDGISIYNNSSYFLDFDSNSGGSTDIRSSADNELFGLGSLTSGGATRFDVRVIATQSFSDSAGLTTPTAVTNSFTTQSVKDYTATSFGTTNGVTLAKIASANPAVIPAAFQDGKFENLGGTTMSGSLTRKYNVTSGSFTSISSSGYYRFHDLKVGISTGSGAFTFVNGSDRVHFYAPRGAINTAIGTNSLSDSGTAHKALTATSRSLSGVPYLQDATFEVSTKITGLFNPLYAGSTTLVDMTTNSVGVGSVSLSGDTISTNGGTIQTSGKVFQSDETTAVNSGVPRYNDIAIVTASVSYDSGTSDNIQQSSTFTDTSFQVLVKARNRDSDQSTLDTQTISYHTAGTFGQPTASGSLGIYGRAQGFDGGSLTGTTETFSGEDFRIQLNNNVTSFAGDAFTTTFQVGGILGNNDLQVKPGFLVDPGGAYRYWYPSNYGTGTYKYYIRRFQTSGTKTSLTVDVGKTLVNWDSDSDGVAVGLILKSGTSAGGNTNITTCRIFDPSEITSNLIEAGITTDNHKNPFSSNIDLYGNTGGSISSTTYTVPIRNADGMFIDNTDNELYVIIRYKGDPSPVSSITISYS